MKRILVLSGIPGEIESFIRTLPAVQTERLHGARFAVGDGVVLGSAGPGKVRAAATFEAAVARFDPASLLCVGTCGALYAGARPGDVVLPDRVLEHDVDWRASGLPRGAISRTNRGSVPDAGIADCLANLPALADERVVSGTLLTGDTVVDARVLDERPELEGELQGVAVDMETAALAAVATLHRIPWAALRVVTDVPRADHAAEGISAHFRRELPGAAKRIAAVLTEFLLAEGS